MTDETTKPEQIAERIIDEVVQLNLDLSSEQVMSFSHYVCCKILSEIPMYIGNINPKWKQFQEVKEIIDCIICIDDIKPEVLPIPEKWSLQVNNYTIMYINKARKEPLDINKYAFVNNISGGVYGHNCIESDHPEITLEQFKKYVLGEEKKEENSYSHSTDSYEKSGSIRSVEFSEKHIKTGSIGSVDFNLNPFETQNNVSTFEFYSTRCWIKERINYINQFIKRTIDSDLCINPDWISERNKLIEKLKNL